MLVTFQSLPNTEAPKADRVWVKHDNNRQKILQLYQKQLEMHGKAYSPFGLIFTTFLHDVEELLELLMRTFTR